MITEISEAPSRRPSPCESCQFSIRCSTKCYRWQRWFGERWRATQKMFGVAVRDDTPPIVGESLMTRLQFARVNTGLSQKELAKRCGLSWQQIHRYETEEGRQVPPETLARLAEALGVAGEELTGQKEDK